MITFNKFLNEKKQPQHDGIIDKNCMTINNLSELKVFIVDDINTYTTAYSNDGKYSFDKSRHRGLYGVSLLTVTKTDKFLKNGSADTVTFTIDDVNNFGEFIDTCSSLECIFDESTCNIFNLLDSDFVFNYSKIKNSLAFNPFSMSKNVTNVGSIKDKKFTKMMAKKILAKLDFISIERDYIAMDDVYTFNDVIDVTYDIIGDLIMELDDKYVTVEAVGDESFVINVHSKLTYLVKRD